MSERAALVIPVYNEGERVLPVVLAGLESESITDVIVVDDGSTDSTNEILANLDSVHVVHHETNRGKGEALETGVWTAEEAGHDRFVFLDGDLQGVSAGHVDALVAKLDTGSVMSIGYLGLRKAFVKKHILNNWGALSGQRALTSEAWGLLSAHDKSGFRIEAALNARVRKQGLHHLISRVALDGVGHVGKQHKEGGWPRALWAYGRTYSSAMATYARIELETIRANGGCVGLG